MGSLWRVVGGLVFWVSVLSVGWAGNGVVVTLPSGKQVELTAEQFATIKAQPGLTFASEMPGSVPENMVAVPIPKELGGGALVGTPAAVAAALNATEVTVGAVAATVAGTAALAVGGLAVAAATAAGTVAGAGAGPGGSPIHHGSPVHHGSPAHHGSPPHHGFP
jgi:hypothetical protein